MSDIHEMAGHRQRAFDAIEEIGRIGSVREALFMFENIADGGERLLAAWKAEHCTKVMAGGGFCGWPRGGYEDGATCGHVDGEQS